MKKYFSILIILCTISPAVAGNEKDVYNKIALEISSLKPKLRNGTMAVLPFESIGFSSASRGVYVSDKISSAISVTGKITLVEREKLQGILKEKELSQIGIIDNNDAQQIGSLLSCDAIIMGRVYKTEIGSDLMVKVIDAKSGTVLLAASHSITGENEIQGKKNLPWYAGTWKVITTAPYLLQQDMRYEKLILRNDDTFSLFLINNADRYVEIQGRYRVEKNNIDYRPMKMYFDENPTSFTSMSSTLEGTIYLVEGRLYFNYVGDGKKERTRHDAMTKQFQCVAELQPETSGK